MTSLSDVAALAGVSLSTASRVMSQSKHPVSEQVRQRVLGAAATLDYEHNGLGRALAAGRTMTVGVIVHDVLDEYFARIVRGIEDTAYALGYTTFVCNSDRDAEREIAYVRKLRSTRVDALIFTAGGIIDREYQRRLFAQVAQVERAGGVVMWLAPQPGRQPTIYYSTRQGMDLVAEHLAGLGHRKVLFLNGPDNIVTSSVRADAFAEAAAERGLTVSSVVQGGFSRQAGRDATDDVVAARRRGVTAVVAVNDYAAYGLMRGLQAIGIRVPEDMSIVGFGDLSISQISQPQMTTVRLPLYRLGAEAMQHAQRVLAGERPRRRRPLPVELVARDSTASRKSAPSKGRDGG